MDKAGTIKPWNRADRRSGEDRRVVEGEPPGKVERRRGIESRRPEVIELEMTPSEWGALSEEPGPTRK